ncbi:MAG: hypothetical protein AB7O26_02640 [Planctomycetaceae bacterium]
MHLSACPAVFGDDKPLRVERPAHYIVENRPIVNELSRTPLPMVDWGFVLAGQIQYVDRTTGQLLPLNDKHDVENPSDVEAVAVTVPSGVRIRTEPATRGKTFAEELFPPEFPWEENCTVHTILFDSTHRKYKVWYRTKGYFAFAESEDFRQWRRPMNGTVPYNSHRETNILGVINRSELASSDLKSLDEARLGYAGGFCVDPTASPGERYKAVFLAHVKGATGDYARSTGRPISAMTGPGSTVMFGAVSADGVGWRVLPKPIMLHDADTLSVPTFDTLAGKFRLYTRLYQHNRRTVAMSETNDFRDWPLPTNILVPDAAEHPSIDYYSSAYAIYPNFPQIQTMLCTVYDRSIDRSEVRIATSRDGHTFNFLPGDPIVSTSAAAGDESGFLAAFPGLVRTPDGRMLCFYDVHRTPHKFPRHRFGGSKHYAAGWKSDRIAGIEAADRGEFTLAPAKLLGSRIVLNMRTERTGRIEAELRDENFAPIPGRTFADCDPLIGDHTSLTASWKGQSDLTAHVGRTIYVSFRLHAAKLFSIAAIETN